MHSVQVRCAACRRVVDAPLALKNKYARDARGVPISICLECHAAEAEQERELYRQSIRSAE